MRLPSSSSHVLWAILAVIALLVDCAAAWGVVGHEIVATIAQTQLHPLVREHLCTILPNNTRYQSPYPRDADFHTHCHLAPYAAWADRVHGQYPWSSHLHYVNPIHDSPPKQCLYGQEGWTSEENVLTALANFTGTLQNAAPGSYERDVALRFVTHFVGDMHQPLHLTGRARGGNDVWVTFEGRTAKLHSVWDSLIISSQIRYLSNYTQPLPNLRIESALRGTIYDNYVRWILQEGLGQGARTGIPGWWEGESEEWPNCPGRAEDLTPPNLQGAALWLRPLVPHTSRAVQKVGALARQTRRRWTGSTRRLAVTGPTDEVDNTDLPICPMAWTRAMHPLACDYAFAPPVPSDDGRPNSSDTSSSSSAAAAEDTEDEVYDDQRRRRRRPSHPYPPPHHPAPRGPELDVPEYLGRVTGNHIVERQLARAGIRLAAILNTLLLPEAEALATASDRGEVNGLDATTFVRLGSGASGTGKGIDDRLEVTKRRHSSGGRGAPIWDLVKVTASSILEVVLLSTVGYVLAHRGVIDKRTQTKINKINVSCFTPALLFSKVAFTLSPGRLAELSIVPLGFVIVTLVSSLVAWGLATAARLTRAQRNFAIACAMSPNSNSLPVALMQSLVATVPQLHWEEDGEPEDTVNGMLGRALTYLVLFSTLGMLTRWSIGAKLLASVDEEENNLAGSTGARRASREAAAAAASTGQTDAPHAKVGPPLIPDAGPQVIVESPSASGIHDVPSAPPQKGASLPAADHLQANAHKPRPDRTRSGPPAWVRSFPNSAGPDEEAEDDDDDDAGDEGEWGESDAAAARRRRRLDRNGGGGGEVTGSALASWARRWRARLRRVGDVVVVRPLRAVASFMTAPLYAAVISLVVAMVRPLQQAIGGIEPLVGALETAGACSIPLTMIVLGAYFVEEKVEDAPPSHPQHRRPSTIPSPLGEASNDGHGAASSSTSFEDPWRRNGPTTPGAATSAEATLVEPYSRSQPAAKRASLPWARNPWKRGGGGGGDEGASASTSGEWAEGGVASEAASSVAVVEEGDKDGEGEGEDEEEEEEPAGREPLTGERMQRRSNSFLRARRAVVEEYGGDGGLAAARTDAEVDEEAARLLGDGGGIPPRPTPSGWRRLLPRRRSTSRLSRAERQRRSQLARERRTILVSIASRMVVTPLLLMPLLAWYAIRTKYNVVDDPVFVTCAALLIGSPPALTLAQITTQSATGDSGFERLISKTIFVSYAVMAAPTTIILVLLALIIMENEPSHAMAAVQAVAGGGAAALAA